MTPFAHLLAELARSGVRFVLIGVGGANFYARSPAGIVTTRDRDLLLPLDAENTLRAWEAAVRAGLALSAAGEPFLPPFDLELAEGVTARQALVRGSDGDTLEIDLTFVMAGFAFESVWMERREFQLDGAPLPVARLAHILESKARADRPKDRLYLATLAEELRDLLREE